MSKKGKTVTRLNSNYMQQYDVYIERQQRKRQRLYRRLVLFSLIAVLAIGSMATYHFKQRMLQAEKREQYEQLEDKFRSEEHTSELQSRGHLVCRLLLEKKK